MTRRKTDYKPKLTDAERHRRFVETANKVGASDKSEDFDKAFANLDIKNASRAYGHTIPEKPES
jgi:hypothetical protein